MAKAKIINGSIYLGPGKKFGPDQVDEFLEEASEEQIKHFADRGVLVFVKKPSQRKKKEEPKEEKAEEPIEESSAADSESGNSKAGVSSKKRRSS